MSPKQLKKMYKKPNRKLRNGVHCGCMQCQIGNVLPKYKNKGNVISHFFL